MQNLLAKSLKLSDTNLNASDIHIRSVDRDTNDSSK